MEWEVKSSADTARVHISSHIASISFCVLSLGRHGIMTWKLQQVNNYSPPCLHRFWTRGLLAKCMHRNREKVTAHPAEKVASWEAAQNHWLHFFLAKFWSTHSFLKGLRTDWSKLLKSVIFFTSPHWSLFFLVREEWERQHDLKTFVSFKLFFSCFWEEQLRKMTPPNESVVHESAMSLPGIQPECADQWQQRNSTVGAPPPSGTLTLPVAL